MSGARVFIGTRSQGKTRLIEVWTYEDAQRFGWTFLARNLPTVADIGLRKLVKLLDRIPDAPDARGVGREALEEWLGAPKAFGMRGGKEADVLKVVDGVDGTYPIGLILNADDNLADVFRPRVAPFGALTGPEDDARYLGDSGQQNVLRVRPRELRDITARLIAATEGRQAPMPDHTFWEHALLHLDDRSVLDLDADDDALPAASPLQRAVEDAILRDDPHALNAALAQGAPAELALSARVHGWRPVALAARSGAARCLALLLEAGADVGPDDLAHAAEAGHGHVVRLLLERRPQLGPKPRRRFFPTASIPDVERSDPGQASPA